MDRVTILCCVNMTGSDKKKLFVIGKSKKPHCFTHISVEKLPVKYLANKKAWMTSNIFVHWLEQWNKELRVKSRKILLIVDNCTAHPTT